ncbi:TIGR01906 family membrane protein [Candidatus Cryosericum hinesii]|uniref:TIGR01906 family membrane protein n=1 Tax=Candidatus Cryosericum hinesii TaxID=2290915 RepID=UPI000E5B6A2E|nr:TIGR01906 family membrane protein [Candidatus Cryosericum hinesii]RIE09208.1 TIGR01906 family membrane protein [Candidatus Cryosericum hinesii]
MPALIVLATATAVVAVLLTPFSLLVNFMPLQRLVLFMVGTTGGTAPRFGVAEAARRVADLLKYLAFRRPLPNDAFYSPLELAHMGDVQAIFQGVYLTALVSCLLTVVLIILLRRNGRDVRRVAQAAGITVLALVAALGTISVTIGFDALFIAFHELAFSNNFWLLPEDSGLIRLFPENYFMSYFFIALSATVVVALILMILSRRRRTPRL